MANLTALRKKGLHHLRSIPFFSKTNLMPQVK